MRCTGVPQTGHGSLKRPCTAISSWNAVTFSGNPSPVCARSRSIQRVSVARVASYSRAELLVGQRARQLERRQPRRVQDLVRVGVADAAEQMRIGERALQRVALAGERLVKLFARGVERLDAAGIERAQRRLAAHQLQRGALLRARFGEEQRAVLEGERGEHLLRPHPRFLAGLPPAQPPGDHEVDDEKQVVGRRSRTMRLPTRRTPRTIWP